MSKHIGEQLDEEEIRRFLQERGLGVLGLAKGGEAYTIPIAFAYDPGENRCIFRFLMGDESLKRSFLAETDVASLTAYKWKTKNQWESVVVRGPISQLPDSELSQAAALFSSVGEQAALDVFNGSISEYETIWYQLEIADITGRGRFVGSRKSLL